MSRDEASAVGWPPDHLRLVPDPDPSDSAAFLRVMILNATDTFGPYSPIVEDLKDKFASAMRAVMAKKKAPAGETGAFPSLMIIDF